MTTEQKIKTIAEHYGYREQKQIAIEEMAELTKAILKWDRTKSNDENFREKLNNIIEELADVSIMTMQLITLLNCDKAVARIIEEKLDRQLERIANGSE